MKFSLHLPLVVRRSLARRLATPLRPQSPARQRRACIYKVDRLGDFVLALGAIRQAVDFFGADQCRLVVSTVAAPLAEAEFPEVERWELPFSLGSLWREIRPLRRQTRTWNGEEFEHLLCLRHPRSLYRDLTLTWLHARRWHGVGGRPSRTSLHFENQPRLPATTRFEAASPPWCGDLLAHRATLREVLGREPTWQEIRPRLRRFIPRRGPEIIFCPFGNDPLRDYPHAAWLEAWRGANSPHAEIRLLGNANRRDELNRLAAGLEQLGAKTTVATDLPLREFVQAIAEARAVITVDSAAAHFATAFDKPATVVVGGGHFGWFVPWGGRVRQHWVSHQLDCYGCHWDCRRASVECLTGIPAPAVARAIRETLLHA